MVLVMVKLYYPSIKVEDIGEGLLPTSQMKKSLS